MNVEEFLEYLKLTRPQNNYPDSITPENINYHKIDENGFLVSYLDLALGQPRAHVKLLPQLLSMGAIIEKSCIVHRPIDENMICLLEICDPKIWDVQVFLFYAWPDKNWQFFMDYGVNVPTKWSIIYENSYGREKVESYASIISSRVASSRKALAALLILRKVTFFRASRDVVVVIAKEMWGARGPGGCGPRAHIWFSGEEEKKLKLKK